MSVTIGPTSWWLRTKEAVDYYARICPRGTILPDGSAIFCGGSDARSGGQVWIVAPSCTQVSSQWASGCWNNTCISTTRTMCCLCEWPGAGGPCARLIACGFNPCDWFIPNQTILFNSYNCRQYWDTCTLTNYWSSTEGSATNACLVRFNYSDQFCASKSFPLCVRSVRCISL